MPNQIECALSQSTSVCGLNPVRSGLEWNVGYDGSLHAHSRARSVRGTQLMAAGWDFAETKALLGIWEDADVQNQIHGIVRNQKVATAMAELGYSRMWRCAKLPVAQRYEHIHISYFYIF